MKGRQSAMSPVRTWRRNNSRRGAPACLPEDEEDEEVATELHTNIPLSQHNHNRHRNRRSAVATLATIYTNEAASGWRQGAVQTGGTASYSGEATTAYKSHTI